MAILSREFYAGDTVETAEKLLGKYLVRRLDSGELLVGRITETEAYAGRCDKACHAYGYKKTARTSTLFAPPGTAYIYLIYGMYHCLNFVTEPEGEPAAILLRAVEPIAGEDIMYRLRYGEKPMTPYRRKNFLNGPGKVCKAFSLTPTAFRPISEAIITDGGVSVKEINPRTMESKIVGGLYFAGEIIDVTGFTGGFNLQIAFSTGYAAAQ